MSVTHGISAEYSEPEAFLAALRSLKARGVTRIQAYMPFPVEGAHAYLPKVASPIPWIMFAAGAVGGCSGFFLQWYASHDFPLNVGGRPLGSWPSFIPVTFELTVLCAALVGLGSFLWIARLPQLHHPVFGDPRFCRASQDRFFVCILANDPKFAIARGTLEETLPDSIEEITA